MKLFFPLPASLPDSCLGIRPISSLILYNSPRLAHQANQLLQQFDRNNESIHVFTKRTVNLNALSGGKTGEMAKAEAIMADWIYVCILADLEMPSSWIVAFLELVHELSLANSS